jgi:hypothetical protein
MHQLMEAEGKAVLYIGLKVVCKCRSSFFCVHYLQFNSESAMRNTKSLSLKSHAEFMHFN